MFFSFFEKFLGIFSQACPYTVIDIEFQEGINMARGQRKTIEEKISEKENLIESLKIRLKSEQREVGEARYPRERGGSRHHPYGYGRRAAGIHDQAFDRIHSAGSHR